MQSFCRPGPGFLSGSLNKKQQLLHDWAYHSRNITTLPWTVGLSRQSFLYSLHVLYGGVLKLGVHPKLCIFIGFSHHRYCKPSIHRSPPIDKNSHIHCWLVVWNIVYFSIHWEFHHPNWRTPSFFRGIGQPPTRLDLHRKVDWSRSGLRLLNLRPSSSARLVNISPISFWVHGTHIYIYIYYIHCKHVFV